MKDRCFFNKWLDTPPMIARMMSMATARNLYVGIAIFALGYLGLAGARELVAGMRQPVAMDAASRFSQIYGGLRLALPQADSFGAKLDCRAIRKIVVLPSCSSCFVNASGHLKFQYEAGNRQTLYVTSDEANMDLLERESKRTGLLVVADFAKAMLPAPLYDQAPFVILLDGQQAVEEVRRWP